VLRNEEAAFHRNRLRAGPDESVYLGYPVEVIRPKGKDAWLVPMFVQPFRAKVTQGLMHLAPAGPLTVNGAWLEGRFQRSEDRDGLLRAIGLLADASGDDGEDDENEVSTAAGPSSFEQLALSALDFVGDLVAEPIRPGMLNLNASDRSLRVGIHNRAVLVMGPRLTYTKGLIRELAAVSRWKDEDLDRTSLRWVFPHDPSPDVGLNWPLPQPPSELKPGMIGALHVLGRTQREAARAAVTLPGLVVTGPPGTGKSELVATILINQLLRGRSALFASKNHRALDAVVPRLNSLSAAGALIIRASNQDLALRRSWRDTLREILARPVTERSELVAALRAGLQGHLGQLAHLDFEWQAMRRRADAHEACLIRLREAERCLVKLGGDNSLVDAWKDPEHGVLLARLEALRARLAPPERGFVRRLFWALSFARRQVTRRECAAIEHKLPTQATRVLTIEVLRALAVAHQLRGEATALEKQLRASPHPSALLEPADAALTAARGEMTRLLDVIASGGASAVLSQDRASLQNLRAMAENLSEVRLQRELPARFPLLLRLQPLWAVSSLSARSSIPLGPAMFDLVIIDEASQCDIASSIPLLARARRAVVVGDPMQLQHVTQLSVTTERTLLEAHGLTEGDLQRLSFRVNSCYDLASGSPDIPERVLLTDHYRSHPEIAAFASEMFYGHALECVTDSARLRAPSGVRPGLHWTDVSGRIEPAPSGVLCREEIDAICKEVVALVQGGFEGSVGVVTPFRHQANRILDALTELLDQSARQRIQLQVSTAHGFQGDERDVILLSLCCGQGMPEGSLRFVAEGPNLFNVAVTRARAVLHVFGDRSWAQASEVRFIRELARRCGLAAPSVAVSTAYESPWEERLDAALAAEGIKTIPQLPVAGRRLDLAVVTPRRLDIEVDGETFHRTASGRRKDDDLWRDLQMQALGWRVRRFWVYELREDMARCVKRVLADLSE